MSYLAKRQLATIEPSHAAQDAWVKEVEVVANSTLFPALRGKICNRGGKQLRRLLPRTAGRHLSVSPARVGSKAGGLFLPEQRQYL